MLVSKMYLWSTTEMWQITWRELKDKKWSLFFYCFGSLFLIWIYAATFRSSQVGTQQLQDLVKGYPKGLQEAFGLNNLSTNTIELYLNAKNFSLIWPLIAIILALSRAAGQIAGEVQSGTMGLLLALPLNRWRIFVAKYTAGIFAVLVFTGISVFGVIPLARAYNIPSHLSILFHAWILTSLFMLAIYSLGLMVSSWVNEKSTVYVTAGIILMLSYIANIVALISDKFNWLKYYSLFYYFDTQTVLTNGHIKLSAFAVFGVIIVVATAVALSRFNQRDISV